MNVLCFTTASISRKQDWKCFYHRTESLPILGI